MHLLQRFLFARSIINVGVPGEITAEGQQRLPYDAAL
jgi:hypothetical protein